MRKICIFLFSGTGMTQYVINKAKAEFEKSNAVVDLKYIEHCQLEEIELSDYEAIGFAYPVHSFNAPKKVINFIKLLPQSNHIPTFILATAGEQSILNYSSSNLLRKILNKKGFDVFYEELFAMPSNFAMKYEENKVQEMLDNVNVDICRAVYQINQNCYFILRRNFGSNLLAFFGRAEWFGARCIGKFFYADKSCVFCGKCEKHCPNQNIQVTDNGINFGRQCGLCMRCVYLCPAGSIKLRQPFKFIVFDRWYESPELKIPGKQ